ncbi:MAG: hypothetical protein JXB14_08095 [Candidatus Altiarchaeota archaeon]|nr:hypothetical protein [Candidatus Altiarchaeota archaeon]
MHPLAIQEVLAGAQKTEKLDRKKVVLGLFQDQALIFEALETHSQFLWQGKETIFADLVAHEKVPLLDEKVFHYDMAGLLSPPGVVFLHAGEVFFKTFQKEGTQSKSWDSRRTRGGGILVKTVVLHQGPD